MIISEKKPTRVDKKELLQREIIKESLQHTTKLVIENLPEVYNIGLYNGRTGIALYLIRYANYFNIKENYQLAIKILNDIGNELTIDCQTGLADGVAGFGMLLEYLTQNAFIEMNTDEVLEDIDDLLHYQLINSTENSLLTVLDFGKYYKIRVENRHNKRTGSTINKHIKIVTELVDILETNFSSYDELFKIIEFLSGVQAFVKNKSKAIDYLNYAIDKLETMISEDIYFNSSFNRTTTLLAALNLKRAGLKTNNSIYLKKAISFLKIYDSKLLKAEHNVGCGIVNNYFLHQCTYESFRKKNHKQLSYRYLTELISDHNMVLQAFALQNLKTSERIVSLAQNGLLLTDAIYQINNSWRDLFY